MNGEDIADIHSGTYLKLARKWTKGDKVNITFPMEEKWVSCSHHSRYVSYNLPGGENMYKEESTDRIPYAFVRGPIVYSLDTVWNKQLCNDGVNMEQDIRVNTTLKPASVSKPDNHMLGPVYQTKALYKGSEVDVTLTPFVNIGQWFRPDGTKPQKNASAFTYGIWLYNVGTK